MLTPSKIYAVKTRQPRLQVQSWKYKVNADSKNTFISVVKMQKKPIIHSFIDLQHGRNDEPGIIL